MTEHGPDPVLRLLDDIARHFAHKPADEAGAAIAEHIRAFWDPRMRRALDAAFQRGALTDPGARYAAALLEE